MQCTKLEVSTKMKALIKEKGPAIIEALKREKESGVTDSNTDKARTTLFLALKSIIDGEGQIFKRESEDAAREISELTANCSLTLKVAEENVKKLQAKFEEGLAKEVVEKLKPIHNAPEIGNRIKAEVGKHFEWRGSLPVMTDVLSNNMIERLNTAYTTWRDAPLKVFMDTKDKFVKTEEYKKRAEHFEIIIKGLAGEGMNRQEIITALGKDLELVTEYAKSLSEDAAKGLTESAKGPKDIKEYAKKGNDWKAYVPRMTGLQNKLKVARSQLHTAQIVRDGFLKKAGPLADSQGTKQMAAEIKNEVGKLEKQVQSFQGAFETYKKEFNKVSTVKV